MTKQRTTSSRARRADLRRLALRECAEIIEAAIGVDLGIYAQVTLPAEQAIIERAMRDVSDALYRRSEK